MNIDNSPIWKLLFVIALLVTAACHQPDQTNVNASGTPATSTSFDSWVGRWQGVEGTYLTISKGGEDIYLIEIANLDGPKSYKGLAVGDHIEFKRNNKVESIRAATGKETGMKWLENEKNCLVVTAGSEGFCRK